MAVWDGGENHIFGIKYGPFLLGEVDDNAKQHLDELDLVLHGGEPVGPEGRVDGPVVPGGEEGCAHVVDQVNHFHLDKLGRSGEMKQGRAKEICNDTQIYGTIKYPVRLFLCFFV